VTNLDFLLLECPGTTSLRFSLVKHRKRPLPNPKLTPHLRCKVPDVAHQSRLSTNHHRILGLVKCAWLACMQVHVWCLDKMNCPVHQRTGKTPAMITALPHQPHYHENQKKKDIKSKHIAGYVVGINI